MHPLAPKNVPADRENFRGDITKRPNGKPKLYRADGERDSYAEDLDGFFFLVGAHILVLFSVLLVTVVSVILVSP